MNTDRSGCPGTRHGTRTAYQKHGCRCPDARAAAHEYKRRYRRVPAPCNPARTRLYRTVDEVVVLRVVDGDPLPMGSAERRLAVARLTAQGKSQFQIAEILGCTPRTVGRHRAQIRQAA